MSIVSQLPTKDESGRVLLPPAMVGQGCPFPAYVNPQQAGRIMKRREARRRLIMAGRLVIQRAVSVESSISSNATFDNTAIGKYAKILSLKLTLESNSMLLENYV